MRAITVYSLLFWIMAVAVYADSSLVQQAEEAYEHGETAKTIAERKEFFNKALSLYKELENQTQAENWKLFFNLGNTYFQLSEYPWAEYYYYKALKLNPYNEKILLNLNIALQKLGLPSETPPTTFEKVIYFHYFLSLPTRIEIFFFLCLLFFSFLSAAIWTRFKLTIPIILTAIAAIILLGSILTSRYFSPIEAIVINHAILYRDAGEEYARVTSQPILSGTKIKVLGIYKEGEWLKILTPNGVIGYINYKNIKVL